MLRDIFKTLGGIESYGLIAMIIFLVCFAILVVHAITLKRKDLEDFSRMPLEDYARNSDEIQDI